APFIINPLPPADLVVSNVVGPDQVVEGSTIQVKYTVTNLGAGPTDLSSWTDAIWLAADKTKYPYLSGILLTTVGHSGVLTNDPHDPDLPQSYTQTVNITLPKHVSGQLFLMPQADVYQQTTETTLAQNVNPDDPNDLPSDNSKARPITVLPTPPPDLIVTSVNTPAAVAAGTSFTVSWSVLNQGAGTTEDSFWHDLVWLSDRPSLTTPGKPPIFL